jgi:hypothetical protein
MKTYLFLMAAAVLLPLGAGAKPTVTVTSPKNNASLTTGILAAAGTAKSTGAPLSAVYYSFDGGQWTLATGTTNWSVAGLSLTPGTNSLSVYATDTSHAASATNKVNIIYAVEIAVSVTIYPTNGGSVTPDYNGKLLQIGDRYKMTAKAANGFKFYGWGIFNPNDAFVTNPQLSFPMQSNLSIHALFLDIGRPLCVITYPAVKHSVSNSPINATVRASDNVGVTAVGYQLNGGGWNTNATSADGTNWSIASLTLKPGANTLQAYAKDAAGNVSLTNSVQFNYVAGTQPPPTGSLAPASLSGLAAEVVGATGDNGIESPFQISFGVSTFAQNTADTNETFVAGNYSYTVLSSNTAQLLLTAVAPPTEADGTTTTRILVFTNSTTCVFTNDSDASVGYVTFSNAPSFVPSTSSFITVRSVDSSNPQMIMTTVFGAGVFTNYSGFGTASQAASGWGTCSVQQFSPLAAVLRMNYTNDTDAGMINYTETSFSTTNAGTYCSLGLEESGDAAYISAGTFTILRTASPQAGNAPASITGKTANVSSPDSRRFSVSFGDCTYTMFDSNANDENSNVADYTYMKTGANTALLVSTTVMPPSDGSNSSMGAQVLTFTSSGGGTAVSADDPSKISNFTLSTANNYAPTSLAGKSLNSSSGGAIKFGDDGTLTWTKSGQTYPADYTYAQYSPVGGMMVVYHSDGSLSFVQLQFTGATAGSWYQTDYDNTGTFEDVSVGTFTNLK